MNQNAHRKPAFGQHRSVTRSPAVNDRIVPSVACRRR
jgi:hypothetical protein